MPTWRPITASQPSQPAFIAPGIKRKRSWGVQVVERWVLARLRHQTSFSLAELNREIDGLRERLNTRAFRKLPGTRQALFTTLDRPAMKTLPAVLGN